MSLEQRQRPRFGKVTDAVRYGAISRARLYQWAARNPELFKKHGRATIVDFDVYDAMLDKLPRAEIKPPAPRKPA